MSTTLVDRVAGLLFPKTRRAVLELLLSHPDESFYLRQIVSMTGLGVGQVQRELKLLQGAVLEPSRFSTAAGGNATRRSTIR